MWTLDMVQIVGSIMIQSLNSNVMDGRITVKQTLKKPDKAQDFIDQLAPIHIFFIQSFYCNQSQVLIVINIPAHVSLLWPIKNIFQQSFILLPYNVLNNNRMHQFHLWQFFVLFSAVRKAISLIKQGIFQQDNFQVEGGYPLL